MSTKIPTLWGVFTASELYLKYSKNRWRQYPTGAGGFQGQGRII